MRAADADATVFTTADKELKLSSLRGKPTVLFYEDRDSTDFNTALKDELFRRGKEEHLLDDVRVIAVANVKGFDWFPARNFVLSAVKDTEKKAGVPVYLDWSGALMGPPLKLPDKDSTVLVLDRDGSVTLKLSGRLKPEARTRVFDALKAELKR